ncbi:MAG: dicarboxylate/amino acid:cation symporter, partial [Bacteroidia bacterium]
LPLGATLNMNGLSAYMGVVAVFATNIYGIEFGLKEMLQVVLTSTIAAIGCAGVLAAGLIVMPVVLSCVGVPLKIIGVMAAVDRIIDMLCTTINITGDTFAAVLVGKSEKEISLKQYQEK